MFPLLLLTADEEWSLPLIALLQREGRACAVVRDIFDTILQLRQQPGCPLLIGPDIPDASLSEILQGLQRHCTPMPRLLLVSDQRSSPADEAEALEAGFDVWLPDAWRHVALARRLREALSDTVEQEDSGAGRASDGSAGRARAANQRGEMHAGNAQGSAVHAGNAQGSAVHAGDGAARDFAETRDEEMRDAARGQGSPATYAADDPTRTRPTAESVGTQPSHSLSTPASFDAPATDSGLRQELVFSPVATAAAGPPRAGANDIERMLRIARHEDYFSLLGLHPSSPADEAGPRAQALLDSLSQTALDPRLQERFLIELQELRAAIGEAAEVLGASRARTLYMEGRSAGSDERTR